MVIVVTARSSSAMQGSLLGDLLAVAGCVCFAAYTLGLRWLRDDATGLQITAVAMVVGTVPLVAISAPALLATSWTEVSGAAWAGLTYASVVAQCVGYIVWSASVRTVGGSRTAIYNCLIPVASTIIARVVFHDQLTILKVVGAVLIVLGILTTRRKPR
jgi:drug/metabolite transporter (DMT)-like permease